MQQPNTTFERMPPILDCIIGMHIMIIQNINKNDKIVHGTIGTLYSILFDPDTLFIVSTDESTGLQIRTPNKLPRYLLIELDKPSFAPWPGLPCNVYPIGKCLYNIYCNYNSFKILSYF